MKRLIDKMGADEGPFPGGPSDWVYREYMAQYPMAKSITLTCDRTTDEVSIYAVFPFVLPIKGAA